MDTSPWLPLWATVGKGSGSVPTSERLCGIEVVLEHASIGLGFRSAHTTSERLAELRLLPTVAHRGQTWASIHNPSGIQILSEPGLFAKATKRKVVGKDKD